MVVKVESWAENRKTSAYEKVTEGLFTFVAINEDHKPVDIDTGQEISGRQTAHGAARPAAPQGAPSPSIVPTDRNRNYLGDIFGGWVLARMDDAAAETALKYTGREVATRGVEDMAFP